MLESLIAMLDELRQNFRLVDVVDILLVSAVVYGALLWFQRAASRGVLAGVAFLSLVYFLARSFDMYLTSLAFHATFAVLLFVLVVVFQEDLRRILESVSALRQIRTKPNTGLPLEITTLSETAFAMAASRTGALIVWKGKEPLTRHLSGGIPLNGSASTQLLQSIFDSSSPGHDGAVVMTGSGVEQFGAHLPISQNVQKIAGRGTRHSAALGLSECSDALIIVVSEERGVVSVAESGKLTEMKSPIALGERLARFQQRAFPGSQQSLWYGALVQHAGLKVVALCVTLIAWFVLVYDPHTIQRTFVAPIEYRNITKQLGLVGSVPNECRVTLSGSERDFRFLDPASLKVSIDLTHMLRGEHEILLSENNIRLPTNLSPYRIDPRVLRLTIDVKPAATNSTAE